VVGRSSYSVFSWNVENMKRHLAGGSSAPLREIVRAHGDPEVVCLQEIRLRPSDDRLIDEMTLALPGYLCGVSLCRDSINAKARGGRMYGVATFVRSELGPAHHTLPWDREGRALITELPQLGVAILNVYAVNGTDKPYYTTSSRHSSATVMRSRDASFSKCGSQRRCCGAAAWR
jgi:exonuclease III